MTREEAIEVLKLVDENASCDDCLYYAQMEDCPTDEDCIIRQALEMAIQALKKENIYDDKEHYVTISKALYDKLNIDYEQALSQQPCDDAVSREWLMRKATERFYTTNYFNHISAMIEEAPSVTQKSGHWISHYDEDAKEGWYECDRCHTERAFNTRFCPDCGACMREGRTLDEFIEDNKESEDKE